MAALTGHKEVIRQEGDVVTYTGCSGLNYYSGGLIMKSGLSTGIIAPASTTGVSTATFLGVVRMGAVLSGTLGDRGLSANAIEVWKKGEFTFDLQGGAGVSANIGQVVYAFNDNTVGVSCASPRLPVGVITGIPNAAQARVRITNFVDGPST